MEMFTNLEPMYTRLTPAGKMEFLKMVFPEGITLEHDDPNSQILICRTDRMNYIFDAIPRESIKYRYIKIGTNGEKAESPVKGPSRDRFRTTVSRHFQRVNNFYSNYYREVAV